MIQLKTEANTTRRDTGQGLLSPKFSCRATRSTPNCGRLFWV